MVFAADLDFIFMDSDSVFLKNPLAFLLNTTASGDADFQVSTDAKELFFKHNKHSNGDPFEGDGSFKNRSFYGSAYLLRVLLHEK
jgi:Nucleotide-diphospho-sugar transferase